MVLLFIYFTFTFGVPADLPYVALSVTVFFGLVTLTVDL